MKVVVGLGNPGRKYSRTRHNVGFEVVARLAEVHAAGPVWSKFDAEICDARISGEKLLLVAPQTYMNRSGRSVRPLLDFYKVPASELLVVCDDLNLDVARLRLRAAGSAGGQKGLQDIMDHLGTQDFARLRIGIGRPPGRMSASAYVLRQFDESEREIVDVAINTAAEAVVQWAHEGVQAAMNKVNASPPKQAN
jgi:PTH1 family peptidyl-tRNA hydrolase